MGASARMRDNYPCIQFSEIEANTALTRPRAHIDCGPVLRLTQASLQLCLRLMTHRAVVRRRRTLVGDPHGEPSSAPIRAEAGTRNFIPSHFDEAGGRCR